MREIEIETKDWDDLEHAQTIRDALVERGASREWVSTADVVALTGLPNHLAERGLKCLAGLGRADVRVLGTDVEFQFENFDTLPRWFGLPSWLQPLRTRVMRVFPNLGDPLIGVFAWPFSGWCVWIG